MTIADEATEALARDEAAVTLARETVALLRDLAARNEAAAEQADVRLAGRTMATFHWAHRGACEVCACLFFKLRRKAVTR